MKLITILSVAFAASLFLISCNGGGDKASSGADSTKTAVTEQAVAFNPVIPEGFVEKPLDEFGIKAVITCPTEAYIYTSKLITNYGEQDQIVVQFDSASDIKLYISKTSDNLETIKANIKKDMFLNFKQFLVEDGSGVVYEAVKNSTDTKVYHFVMLIKNGDVTYKVESDNMKDYTVDQTATLYAMAKSIALK